MWAVFEFSFTYVHTLHSIVRVVCTGGCILHNRASWCRWPPLHNSNICYRGLCHQQTQCHQNILYHETCSLRVENFRYFWDDWENSPQWKLLGRFFPGKLLLQFFNRSPSQDMQHCLWTGWLQLEGGQRFLSHRTEPSRQTHTAHGSDASSHVSPLARSRPSYRQPAREMRHIENTIRLKKSVVSCVTEQLHETCWGLLLQRMT